MNLIKHSQCLLYLQMMLDKRTNQSILRLEGGCFSSREKDKGEKGPVAANGEGDGDHKRKPQHERTEVPNHVPLHSNTLGPGNVSTPPAVEKTSPLASPGMGKLTYNPITHVPSMRNFICTCSIHACVSNSGFYIISESLRLLY